MIVPILAEKPSKLRVKFLMDYAAVHGIDTHTALFYIKTGIHFKHMTDDWYRFVDAGDMFNAYKVYDDEYYFTDVWNCFVTYSRRYLRDFYKPTLFNSTSVMDATKECKSIVDIGCGIGYSTAALTQMYPGAKVYGLNLRNTKQWTFCETVAKEHGFTMIENIEEIPGSIDMVFASEFFEHLEDPIYYVQHIQYTLKPKCMVIANSFNTHAIGHFNIYKHLGHDIPASEMSRRFNQHVENLGYIRSPHKFFNNKPTVWVQP